MIFVTVGTGKLGFNDLIQKMDSIIPFLDQSVIMQIGNSTYKPINVEFFEFTDDIHNYYKKSELVITGGGVGTIFELLYLGKKGIAVNNYNCYDQHQNDILEKISKENWFFVCSDLNNIYDIILKSFQKNLNKYKKPLCTIEKDIIKYLHA